MKNQQLLFISIVYLIVSFVVLFIFNGVGVEADSINHYLYAKYAPKHPELYLNHWAKPLFTLLVSPFAQFGILGAKLFNVLAGLLSVIYTFKIADQLNLKNPFLAPLFFLIFPLSFISTYSGFTEPLFAALLSISIYNCIRRRIVLAAIIVSFLPFVRSEGLLFLAVFGGYFIYNKSAKGFIALSIGHIIYSLIGWSYYNDLLWVFTKIPYAHFSSHYGNGQLFHFAEQLIYMTGVPLLIFFLLGLVRSAIPKAIKIKNSPDFYILILGGFLLFFIAHSLFWYLGIFNSMGLKRVFAAITPLMAIIALVGFNSIELIRLGLLRKMAKGISLAYIIVFPFTSNPAAIDWKEELNLSNAQLNAEEVADYIQDENLNDSRFVYTDPYLGEALNIDPFDIKKRMILAPQALEELESGDLIIWDNWHTVVDYGLSMQKLERDTSLIKLQEVKREKSTYIIYKKRD